MPYAKNYTGISITIHKDLLKAVDDIINVANKQIKSDEEKLTRSKLITVALCTYFDEARQIKVKKKESKEED